MFARTQPYTTCNLHRLSGKKQPVMTLFIPQELNLLKNR